MTTPILDRLPFPFADPTGQQLHRNLTNLYPTVSQASMVAGNAGIDLTFLDTQQPPVFLWRDILTLAAQGGLTRHLVATVRDTLNEHHRYRQFFDDLLADRQAPIDSEPRTVNGSPIFIKDDDSVSEPEALLFRDDLTLETGRLPAFIATLQALRGLTAAVCKIESRLPRGIESGTGFRIAPDLVLTNWHVLHNARGTGDRATAATLEFNFEDDGRGGSVASHAVPGDIGSVVTEKAHDWAVIRPATALPDEFPIVKLSEAVDPVDGEAAYIVQHPGGRRKRLGFVRNQISDFDDDVVHYLTDTEPGSSGSPVFNAAGRLIGLHHAGGTPQNVTGLTPITKNEGIRIPRVVAGLQQEGIEVP